VRVINERRERERQLMQLAKFDPVTGGLNRAHLAELLGAKLDEAMGFAIRWAFC
jgi:GGDEF domain-containing protein